MCEGAGEGVATSQSHREERSGLETRGGWSLWLSWSTTIREWWAQYFMLRTPPILSRTVNEHSRALSLLHCPQPLIPLRIQSPFGNGVHLSLVATL